LRYLHPVTMKEKFVASGTYVHYKDGVETGSVEHWSIHEQPDGAQFIRVDDDWRKLDGSSVLLEAWRSPLVDGGYVERVDISAFGPKKADVKRIKATFTVIDGVLEIGRTIDEQDREQFEMELPDGYILAPESLIFGGYEASHLAVRPGEPMPVLSYLPTFLNASVAFRPTMYYQSARFIADETLTLGDTTYEARRYAQLNPKTGETLILWVDKYDVLLRYTAQDEAYHAILTQYSRRPDPESTEGKDTQSDD